MPVVAESAAGARALRSLRLASLVLADAARVYVRGLPVIVPVAVIVFGAIDVATHVMGDMLNHPVQTIDTGSIAFGVAIILVFLATLMLGEVLFAGLLDRVVEADLDGRPSPWGSWASSSSCCPAWRCSRCSGSPAHWWSSRA